MNTDQWSRPWYLTSTSWIWELSTAGILDDFMDCFIIVHYIFWNSYSISFGDTSIRITQGQCIGSKTRCHWPTGDWSRNDIPSPQFSFWVTWIIFWCFCIGLSITCVVLLPWRGITVQLVSKNLRVDWWVVYPNKVIFPLGFMTNIILFIEIQTDITNICWYILSPQLLSYLCYSSLFPTVPLSEYFIPGWLVPRMSIQYPHHQQKKIPPG